MLLVHESLPSQLILPVADEIIGDCQLLYPLQCIDSLVRFNEANEHEYASSQSKLNTNLALKTSTVQSLTLMLWIARQ